MNRQFSASRRENKSSLLLSFPPMFEVLKVGKALAIEFSSLGFSGVMLKYIMHCGLL